MTHLSTRELHASHGTRKVLHGVTLSILPGQVTAIVGPNGCGKSTLLRCLARLHRPATGTVTLDGSDVWRLRPTDAARQIAMLAQAPQAPGDMRAADLVRFGRHPHQGLFRQWSQDDEQAVHAAMRDCDVLDLAARRIDELSGGQRQRCWLAMALAQQTRYLLLDEPTSMLDLGHALDVLDRVRALAVQGRAVAMVLHDLNAAARHADVLVAIRDGRVIACGAPRQVLTRELVRALYDIEADILHAPGDGAPVVVPRRTHEAVALARMA
jgi:iron complex transport system ATP-binding protein